MRNAHQVQLFASWTFKICIAVLDQELIVLYLAWKRVNANGVHQDLFITPRLDAMSYPTVAPFLRETPLTHKQLPAREQAIERALSAVDLGIIQALSDELLASVRQLARRHVFRKAQCMDIW
jgi:hypothetical protein